MFRTTGLRRRLAALGALSLALALATSCSLIPSQSVQDGLGQVKSNVTKDFTVGAAPELVVDDQVGAISVQAGDSGKISVEATKRASNQAALDKIEVGMTQSGDVVRLEFKLPQGVRGFSTDNQNVEFKVKVPAGTKTSLTTETGAIDASGLNNGLTAKATTGAITTQNVKGLQVLTATTGAINAIGADGTVQASTRTGEVSIDGNLSGENWARASTGAVAAKVPSSANLKVTAKGTSVQDDFGLSGQRGALSGSIGTGAGGSLDVSTSTGLAAILKK